MRRLELGTDRIAFGLVAGPPTVSDRIRGRRTGTLEDYVTLVKLAQSFDVIHFVGNQPTSPQELPAPTRHLDTYRANLMYTDRAFHCLAIGRERTLDGIEMMAISRGPHAARRSWTTRASSRSSRSTRRDVSTRR